MFYTISRLSNVYKKNDPSPCEEARKETCLIWDVRSFKTEEEFDNSEWCGQKQGPWRSKGIGHRIVDEHIARQVLREEWIINIESLEELNNLAVKYGEIAITHDSYPITEGITHHIEILDDYR